MAGIENATFDTRRCPHPAPAALLRLMGECVFCGHCGKDVPDFLARVVVYCDGSAVHIEQEDFGTLHVCGEHDAIDTAIEELVSLTA